MAEKNIEKLLEGQTKEILRHQKILLESFQKETKILAESLTSAHKKLDVTMEMVANNTENIELIKNSIKRKVDIEEFEFLTKRVMVLEKKLLIAK